MNGTSYTKLVYDVPFMTAAVGGTQETRLCAVVGIIREYILKGCTENV
jgi:uncharacterized protein (UPF0210 family)